MEVGCGQSDKVQKGSSWQRFGRKQMHQDDFLQGHRRECCSMQKMTPWRGRAQTFYGAVRSIKKKKAECVLGCSKENLCTHSMALVFQVYPGFW